MTNYRNPALQSIYKSQGVVQVNVPAESGEMGILANHVPSIEQLKPGLIEVIEETGTSKQFFRTFQSITEKKKIIVPGWGGISPRS